MSETEARRLVARAVSAELRLDMHVRTYRGIDLLGDPEYTRLLTARDNARNALVAALTGDAS